MRDYAKLRLQLFDKHWLLGAMRRRQAAEALAAEEAGAAARILAVAIAQSDDARVQRIAHGALMAWSAELVLPIVFPLWADTRNRQLKKIVDTKRLEIRDEWVEPAPILGDEAIDLVKARDKLVEIRQLDVGPDRVRSISAKPSRVVARSHTNVLTHHGRRQSVVEEIAAQDTVRAARYLADIVVDDEAVDEWLLAIKALNAGEPDVVVAALLPVWQRTGNVDILQILAYKRAEADRAVLPPEKAKLPIPPLEYLIRTVNDRKYSPWQQHDMERRWDLLIRKVVLHDRKDWQQLWELCGVLSPYVSLSILWRLSHTPFEPERNTMLYQELRDLARRTKNKRLPTRKGAYRLYMLMRKPIRVWDSADFQLAHQDSDAAQNMSPKQIERRLWLDFCRALSQVSWQDDIWIDSPDDWDIEISD